jgi:hypothetical protein
MGEGASEEQKQGTGMALNPTECSGRGRCMTRSMPALPIRSLVVHWVWRRRRRPHPPAATGLQLRKREGTGAQWSATATPPRRR